MEKPPQINEARNLRSKLPWEGRVETPLTDYRVWGYNIITSPSGKKIWAKKLQLEATRKLREDGETPGDIAAELGAHECLVRKWWLADRRIRGEKIAFQGPAFTELDLIVDENSDPAAAVSTSHLTMGRVLLGKLCIEFPISISETELMKLLRVAGAVA